MLAVCITHASGTGQYYVLVASRCIMRKDLISSMVYRSGSPILYFKKDKWY